MCHNNRLAVNHRLNGCIFSAVGPEDILQKHTDLKVFSKIDLKEVHHQFPLDESSMQITTTNMPYSGSVSTEFVFWPQ